MSKKKLRLLKYLFLVLMYIGLILPTAILFIKNRQIYFTKVEGWSISMGGMVALAYGCYIAKVGLKKFKPLVASLVFMIVMICFNSISEFMAIHSVALFIGICLYNAFSLPYKYFKKTLDTYVDEEIRQGVRKSTSSKSDTLDSGRC